jgi:hypothetical protein
VLHSYVSGAYCHIAHFEDCQRILRRLIANGDAKGLPFAESAITEYWDATFPAARQSGLRYLQLEVLGQRNAVVGAQRDFAQAVNDLIEKKLSGE